MGEGHAQWEKSCSLGKFMQSGEICAYWGNSCIVGKFMPSEDIDEQWRNSCSGEFMHSGEIYAEGKFIHTWVIHA